VAWYSISPAYLESVQDPIGLAPKTVTLLAD
jgi:hypothetical protein